MALDFETAWDFAHDPQMREPVGYCWWCGGEIYDADELTRNEGLCQLCFYEQLEPDPDDGDPDAPLNNEEEAEHGEN